MENNYKSLSKHLGIRLIVGFLLGFIVFCLLCALGTHYLDEHFAHSKFLYKSIKSDVGSFQTYVTENKISTKDAKQIYDWSEQNKIAYVCISKNDTLIFDSIYFNENISDYSSSNVSDEFSQFFFSVNFADGKADVYIYNNYEEKLYILYYFGALLFSSSIFLAYFLLEIKRKTDYLKYLSSEISLIESGYWNHDIKIKGNDDLSYLGCAINNMRISIQANKAKEDQLRQLQNEVVTSIAHDLRTPLTSLTTYLELLKRKSQDSAQINYVDKCLKKADQITDLSDQLFDYFFIQSQEDSLISFENVNQILSDQFSEFYMILNENGFKTDIEKAVLPDSRVEIIPGYIPRIIDNLLSNIKKYADHEVPVVFTTYKSENNIGIRIENGIAKPSHTPASNRIGLNNVFSMMEKMHGSCRIEKSERRFIITLEFSVVKTS